LNKLAKSITNFSYNKRALKFFSNFSYTLISNLVSLVASALAILIVPKLIGVEEYGYWQLYLFYSTYVGFMHFGWNDGIYLRYGGKKYEDLNKSLFFSQFYMLVIMQLIIAVGIAIATIFIFNDENRTFILQMTALCLLIVNLGHMLFFILQGTNRIKEYALVTIIGRIIYLSLMIFLLLIIGVRDFKLLIIADLMGKLASLGFAIYICRDFVFLKISKFYFSFREALENIIVGIKLMFANIASLFIIGTVRFGIERAWDVISFGKVSLTLSLSNFMMIFINALGIIMFPILRRADQKKLPSIYITMRDFLMIVLLAILIIYYPFKVIMSLWLPEYADSLIYMALLLPLCVYEGKMALLINTYLKTMRKEKLMLNINLISLIVSIVLTVITTIFIKNLDLAVLSIVIILAFRCIIAEVILAKKLGVSVYKDIIFELTITTIFITSAWFIHSWSVVIMYVLAYCVYLVIKRKDISSTINNIKLLMRS
jgi:O-antigen/teichoic acid export membrane protein